MQDYIGTKLVSAEPQSINGKEGYKVVYPDGYESWSPANVFEDAYRPTNGMNFGLAVEAMKLGLTVCRAGWKNKKLYCLMSKELAGVPRYETNSKENQTLPCPCFVMHEKIDNRADITVYKATQTDMLADDWRFA